jgi:hypothetical protein
LGYLHRVRHHLQTLRMIAFPIFLIFATTASSDALGRDFRTNCCIVQDAPSWASPRLIRGIADRISSELQWSIRRFALIFYKNDQAFAASSRLGFRVNGFFRPKDQSIHIGPNVNSKKFPKTFGHELVHLIFAQKHRAAIPDWLEEGLANFIGSKRRVKYKWLAKQRLVPVTQLTHPNKDRSGSKYHYQASTAAAEMIASRCNLKDLLMLSVGRNLENYLSRLCKIENVDTAFYSWIEQRSQSRPRGFK